MNYDFLTWLSLEMSDLMLSALSTLATPSPPLLLSVSYLWQLKLLGQNIWVRGLQVKFTMFELEM